MTDSEPTGPAWLPDPTGRHDHRWFDGTSFTDHVADSGIATVDPGHLATPPRWASVPVAPAPAGPPAKGRRVLPFALAAVGVVLVGGGVAFLLLGRDDADTGTFEGRIDSDSPVGVHTVDLTTGEALTIDLAPDSDLDAVIGILVDDDTADDLEDAYGDAVDLDRQSLADAFGVDPDELGLDADQVLLRTDLGFAGENEQLVLGAPAEMEVHVVVGPFEADTDIGGYEITLETFPLDVGEEPDGEELLDAVVDDDEIPDDFTQVAEDLLATNQD